MNGGYSYYPERTFTEAGFDDAVKAINFHDTNHIAIKSEPGISEINTVKKYGPHEKGHTVSDIFGGFNEEEANIVAPFFDNDRWKGIAEEIPGAASAGMMDEIAESIIDIDRKLIGDKNLLKMSVDE